MIYLNHGATFISDDLVNIEIRTPISIEQHTDEKILAAILEVIDLLSRGSKELKFSK